MINQQSWAHNLLGGFIIGVGFIIPGVSGAVLALILGLYQPILEAVAKPFANWQKNLRLLLPIALGAGGSLIFFARILQYLFAHYPLPTLYLFFGLVLGALPAMFAMANSKGFRLQFVTIFALGFLLLNFITRAPSLLASGTVAGFTSPFGLLILGTLVGFGVVVPGLSVSFLLLACGVYELVLGAVVDLNFTILIPIIIGFIPGLMGSSRLGAYLFKRHFGAASYLILGLLIASLFAAFPGWPRSQLETALALPALISGIWFSIWFSKKQAA